MSFNSMPMPSHSERSLSRFRASILYFQEYCVEFWQSVKEKPDFTWFFLSFKGERLVKTEPYCQRRIPFLCLSSLVNYFFFSFFFFFMRVGSCVYELQKVRLMKSYCKKKPCNWFLCPRNTDTCQNMDLWGKWRRGDLTAPTVLLHFLYGSMASCSYGYLSSSDLALLSIKM